ncbi:hypothetical protein I4U23_021754 [Adineta vaga]|nr:hypothetical protein I4U23_021754 [Adineta vaga]
MKDSFAELNKSPDEILLIIFKNLDNCHILYSFLGVNQRLTKIVHDFLFTNHLTLFKHSSSDIISRLSDSMLDRFCSEISPKINDKINWLDIEISSVQRILLVRNYRNLFGLGLYNIETENDVQFLKEDTFIERFQNQISSFVVKCIDQQETSKTVNTK